MPISAQDAGRAAAAAQAAVNRRRVPKLPAMLQKVSEDTRVWIYNVGPFPLSRELGSIGTFRIAACPDDKEYVAALSIPGIFTEPVPGQDQNSMELRTEPGGGRYIAEQILGVGPFLAPSMSYVNQGCFIGSQVGPNAKPTKEELFAAKEALNGYLHQLVAEARQAWENNQHKEIVNRHRLAARRLKLENEDWYTARAAKTRQECPMCGTISNEGIVLCPSCKFVLDPDKYARMKDRIAK